MSIPMDLMPLAGGKSRVKSTTYEKYVARNNLKGSKFWPGGYKTIHRKGYANPHPAKAKPARKPRAKKAPGARAPRKRAHSLTQGFHLKRHSTSRYKDKNGVLRRYPEVKNRSPSKMAAKRAKAAKYRAAAKARKAHKSASKHGGIAEFEAPIYGGAGGDYFQDYAQVGGHDQSMYGMYADPRIAGADYGMQGGYDMMDPRMAGAEMYYDPRYAGAIAPVVQDPYAEWAQARYAGGMEPFDQAPLIGGEFAMDTALVAGNKAARSRSRSHSHSRSKGKKAKKAKKPANKGKHLVRAHRSHSASGKGEMVLAHYAAPASPRRRRSAPHRRGGLEEPLIGGYEAPLIGGYDAPAFYPPITGGAFDFPMEPITARNGGKKHGKKKAHGKKH